MAKLTPISFPKVERTDDLARSVLDHRMFEFLQVVEAIHYRYGIDFRDYAQASLARRLEQFSKRLELVSLSALVPKLLHEPESFDQLMKELSQSVTSMFLDPPVFKQIREEIMPLLAGYDRINVLHVGCGTGEEVYSMAILLHEAGMLNKAAIHAVDINPHALQVAEGGIYPAHQVQTFTKNYKHSGGKASFSDYYTRSE